MQSIPLSLTIANASFLLKSVLLTTLSTPQVIKTERENRKPFCFFSVFIFYMMGRNNWENLLSLDFSFTKRMIDTFSEEEIIDIFKKPSSQRSHDEVNKSIRWLQSVWSKADKLGYKKFYPPFFSLLLLLLLFLYLLFVLFSFLYLLDLQVLLLL